MFFSFVVELGRWVFAALIIRYLFCETEYVFEYAVYGENDGEVYYFHLLMFAMLAILAGSFSQESVALLIVAFSSLVFCLLLILARSISHVLRLLGIPWERPKR